MIHLSIPQAVQWLCWLTALSVLVQSAEYLRLQSGPASRAPWPWHIQRDDLRASSPRVRRCFDWLFEDRVHRAQLLLHALAALSLPIAGPTPGAALLLLCSQVLISIRWRGAFNGGSDFMTLAVLTGLATGAITTLWKGPTLGCTAGLWLISIQALSSYFLSGSVKLLHPGWRNGQALPALLDGGIYGPLARDSVLRRRPIAVVCSWAFIVWEALFPLAMIDPRITTLWCAIGAVFHFLVWWYFGLNRFFWAWCATYPALIGCATLLQA